MARPIEIQSFARSVAYLGTPAKIRAAIRYEFGAEHDRVSDSFLARVVQDRRRQFERARELVGKRGVVR